MSVIGPEAAGAVKASLDSDQQRRLDEAQQAFTTVPPEERRRMLRSFAQVCRRPASDPPDDVAPVTAPPLLPNFGPAPRLPRSPGDDTAELPCQPPDESFCHFLLDASPGVAAGLIARERPETIALVAAYAPEDVASHLMAHLPVETGRQVALAIAHMGRPPAPGVLRCIAEELEEALRLHEDEAQRRRDGVFAVARALTQSNEETIDELLSVLEERDPMLAAEVAEELGIGSTLPMEPTYEQPGPDIEQLEPALTAELLGLPLMADSDLQPAAGLAG